MNKENVTEIVRRMIEIIKEEGYGTSEGSYTRDIVTNPVAIEIDGLEQKLIDTIDRRFSGEATGGELDVICNDDGVYREPAVSAETTLLVAGVNGAEIKIGYMANRADGVSYRVIEDATIVNFETHVKAECVTEGSIGNCGIGEINILAESYPGLSGVTNEEEVVNGSDEESDESLLTRRNDRISHPATSWNQWWYRDEALKVEGVGKATCIPRWEGAGTVRVIITGEDYSAASNELIEEVKNYIDNQFINDISLTVDTISFTDLEINIEGTLNADFDKESAKRTIVEELNAYFKAALFKSSTIYYPYINEVLMHSDALYNVTNLVVNGGKDNITIDPHELARVMVENLTLN